jgi:transforming growth factor-beta-induced protein
MGANVLACFPSGISKLSNCFPYCMGLHLLNGANAQPLVMRGASSWSDGILLASRSCVRPDASPPIGEGDATHCYLSAPVGVTATDVAAGNGVVHAIDQVLLPPTVVDLAVGAPSTFSTLVTALQETNLVSALQEGGLFTVFAPTNEAFAALGDALTILRKPWNRDLLAEVLKFHVLGAEKRAEALHTSILPTLAEPTRPTLAVVREGSNLTAGGQAVATADLEAANGVVHVLRGVMLPPGFSVPPATVVDVAAGNPDFSTLVQLVTAAGLGDALKADGPYTVFAPTNAAFAKLPPALVTALLRPENKAKLQQILTYHVVSAAVLARDLKAGAVTTLEGSAVQVALPTAGPTLNADVRVVATDVRAGNGVVHVVDSVLVPPTFVAP